MSERGGEDVRDSEKAGQGSEGRQAATFAHPALDEQHVSARGAEQHGPAPCCPASGPRVDAAPRRGPGGMLARASIAALHLLLAARFARHPRPRASPAWPGASGRLGRPME